MNCPNCGKEVRGHFCTNCGTRVDQALSSQDQAQGSNPEATAYIRQEDLARMAEAEAAQESNRDTNPASPSEAEPFSSSASTPQSDAEKTIWTTPVPRSEQGSPYSSGPFPSSSAAETGSQAQGSGGWGGTDARWHSGFGEAQVNTGPTAVMQPMSLGQIISGTFDILRARMSQFLGVALAFAVAMFVAGLIFALIAGSAISSGSVGASALAIVIGGLILFAVFIVAGSVAGAAYINISRGDENTQSGNLVADTQAIIQRAMTDAPRLFLALLLVAGIYVVGSVIANILGQTLGPVGGIIRLAWFVAAIWYEVTFIFTAQAAVIDGQSPVDAMTESRQLVTGYWWRTFGYSLVGAVMLIPAYIVAAIIIAILGVILSHIPVLGGIVVALVSAAAFSAVYAFIITYLTLMFFDLKARRAGMTQQTAVPSF